VVVARIVVVVAPAVVVVAPTVVVVAVGSVVVVATTDVLVVDEVEVDDVLVELVLDVEVEVVVDVGPGSTCASAAPATPLHASSTPTISNDAATIRSLGPPDFSTAPTPRSVPRGRP